MRKCILVGNLKSMNKYAVDTKKRSQTLLIVEGNHEKNKLFWLILKCFPEINIDMNNVWIYGTNIYLLYEDIVKEYGENWAEQNEDVDLPFVISKKQTPNSRQSKDDFTNIILVFDYERHDTNFSEQKILNMQTCFSDVTDKGQLYINYPMIESYQHLKQLPDCDYLERKIPVTLQPGRRYKELVSRESFVENIVDFPYRIDDLMKERFRITDQQVRNSCCESILDISDSTELANNLQTILCDAMKNTGRKTLAYQLRDWISKVGYAYNGKSYWGHVRKLFLGIIYHNVWKANFIQNNQKRIEENQYKDCYESIDLLKILNIQNSVSQNDISGYIWVLNTCIFFIADYKFVFDKTNETVYESIL